MQTLKGLFERDNKLYVRKVYKNSAGKRKYIWRKVESRTDAKRVLREIENELERGTESFENRDTLNAYLDKWLLMTKGHDLRPDPRRLRESLALILSAGAMHETSLIGKADGHPERNNRYVGTWSVTQDH